MMTPVPHVDFVYELHCVVARHNKQDASSIRLSLRHPPLSHSRYANLPKKSIVKLPCIKLTANDVCAANSAGISYIPQQRI